MGEVPIVDVAPLVGDGDVDAAGRQRCAAAIDRACRDTGFFYVVGHGVPDDLTDRVDREVRAFFAQPDEAKAVIGMARGGRAWRGWFPVGDELTSGRPDRKEGIYFGAELGADDPRVRAGRPLHGPNLFPDEPAGLRPAVLAYIDALTSLGHALVRGIALGLGLDEGWFAEHLTDDPTVLFRIFHYPPAQADDEDWGVGEHTDYGLLTILRQDTAGGLEVHSQGGWVSAPPVEGSFVCNLGDMLERMTGGLYRSTPHRVRNTSREERISMAFFFDPAWDAAVVPIPDTVSEGGAAESSHARWDGADPLAFTGTYGEYLLSKVAKVFPALGSDVLEGDAGP
jgi:isopenicillin N synthase-like dioxygenase